MRRVSVGLSVGGAVLAAAAWCGPAGAQTARSGEGGYGGGLIEYLVTGGGAPRAGVPQGAAPVQRAALAPRLEPYTGDPLPEAAPPAYGPAPRAAGYGVQGYGPQGYGQGLGPGAEPQGYGQADAVRLSRGIDPSFRRQEVDFTGAQRPGTIVIDTAAKHLYLVQADHRAIRYGIGVGRPGFAWTGLKTVSRKAEWPDWTPPAEMLTRRPDLPRHMEGGPANPLGARALYLGSSLYRIHGTNEPHTIGQSVSSGCIRMMNEDVVDLYDRVPVGTRVEVL